MPNAVCAYSGAAGACSTRTWLQSQPSSSATTIGMDVQTPWPISECLRRIVTLSSGAMRMNAFGDTGFFAAAGASSASARRIAVGTKNAMTSAPPVLRNVRREGAAGSRSRHMAFLLRECRGAMHGRADALVRAAAAKIAGHRGVDVGVGRVGLVL